MTVTLDPTRWWECPSCGHQATTTDSRPITPMHPCAGVGGLDVPLVQVLDNYGLTRGMVRHVVATREDYVSGEQGVTLDESGRPIMAIRTERADGSNDVHVFAPTATATAERE